MTNQTTEINPLVTASIAHNAIQDKIARWKESDTHQKAWRDIELKLRAELIAELFPIDKAGTEHHELNAGWKLTVTKGIDYKLDADKTADVLNGFSDDTAALLVKWEPKLSVSNFKKLSAEDQAKFVDVLTTKPSSPQLKLVEPKS